VDAFDVHQDRLGCGSATRKSRISPKSTSTAPPSETMLVKPTPACAAQSRIAPQIAPTARRARAGRDCAERAGERRVEPDVGAHDAEAVRADDAHAAAPCRRLQRGLQVRAFGAGLAESAGEHHRAFHARRAGFLDQPGHGARRRGDDRELRRVRQLAQARIAALAEDLGVFRVHG
jgi:hypothetical protein